MIIRSKLKIIILVLIAINACKPAGVGSHSSSAPAIDDNKTAPEDKEGLNTQPNEQDSLTVIINKEIPIPDDDFVFEFLDNNCSVCHGYDESGKPNIFHAAWPMAKNRLEKEDLEISTLSAAVYQSLFHKILPNAPNTPASMPKRDLDDDLELEIKKVLRWFHTQVPIIVSEAQSLYGNVNNNEQVEIDFTFECSEKISSEDFLNRFFLAAFNRIPNFEERTNFLSNSPTTIDNENAIKFIALLDENNYQSEFKENGLKKISHYISGSGAIDFNGPFKPEAYADLQNEFYQQMLHRFSEWSYLDYFFKPFVRVSKNTAEFYGCVNNSSEWTDCPLSKPRSGFFDTLGFLNTNQSSYLVENNNYGRVASMYFVLWGEGFEASNDVSSNDQAIPPLPTCLEQIDTRYKGGGARGVASIPKTDRLCQSCHISRHLAAGSVLFRPFSSGGLIFTDSNLGILDSGDYQAAIGDDWTYIPKGSTDQVPVDYKMIDNLILERGTACAELAGGSQIPFHSARDLGRYLVSNPNLAFKGFARHAHRAFSNSSGVNFELIQKMQESFQLNKTKILDLTKVYFSSETFQCKAGTGEVE